MRDYTSHIRMRDYTFLIYWCIWGSSGYLQAAIFEIIAFQPIEMDLMHPDLDMTAGEVLLHILLRLRGRWSLYILLG